MPKSGRKDQEDRNAGGGLRAAVDAAVNPVEELHEIRRRLYKKAGGTPETYVQYLMKQQEQYADRLVDFSKPGRKAPRGKRRAIDNRSIPFPFFCNS